MLSRFSPTTTARHTTDVTVRIPDLALPSSFSNTHAVWSNFEIGDLDFWRNETYTKFFDYLDQKGGFYYEVRLIALQMDYTWLVYSAGAMLLCIVSALPCSLVRIKYISSRILVIAMNLSNIAHKEPLTLAASVGAILKTILVRFRLAWLDFFWPYPYVWQITNGILAWKDTMASSHNVFNVFHVLL